MSLSSTVISLVPFDIREEKPGLFPGRFFIPKSDMKTPSLLKVGTASHFVYLDQDRGSLRVSDPSDDVARAIVEDYSSSQLCVDDNSAPALFWKDEDLSLPMVMEKCKGDIAHHLERQKRWFLNVARLADNDWSRYHQHNVVSDFQRDCAKYLGWDPETHEWMAAKTVEPTSACPVCGSPVPKIAIVCPNCKVVLDEAKAKERNLKFVSV